MQGTDVGQVRRDLGPGREVGVLLYELVDASAEHVDMVEAFGEESSGDAHGDLLAVVYADDLGLVFVVFLVRLRVPTRRALTGTALQTSSSEAR